MEELEKTALEMERAELNLLVQNGIKFNVTAKIRKRKKGIKGILGKKETFGETFTYEIKEPTLDTLDRISEISLKMVINEDELKGDGSDVLSKTKKLAKENARNLARIIAVAVLGEDYYETEITHTPGGAMKIKRYKNDEKLNSLSDLFFHAIKPSQLVELASVVTSISNLGDFLVSMRLLSDARTTQPIKESIED
jgi:hypothetical protein